MTNNVPKKDEGNSGAQVIIEEDKLPSELLLVSKKSAYPFLHHLFKIIVI